MIRKDESGAEKFVQETVDELETFPLPLETNLQSELEQIPCEKETPTQTFMRPPPTIPPTHNLMISSPTISLPSNPIPETSTLPIQPERRLDYVFYQKNGMMRKSSNHFSVASMLFTSLFVNAHECEKMRDSRFCHDKSMDYLGNNKWSFERIPNMQGSWLQFTANQLINCRLEEVTLETKCANCTISSPIGDIPGGINGSVSHNLVTIVWKESLREVQQCKLRLVETGIAQRYLTNNSEIERIRVVEQQLDFVYNTTNKEYCNSSEKSYKQVIGMDKVILRLHSLTDTNAQPIKPLEEDIEKIADIIRAEISGVAHSQYARDRTTDGINGGAREIRALKCENRVLAHKTAIATAQHSGWLAANYLNLPTCSKLLATGESISVYHCSPKNSTITTEITNCGPQPKLGDYTLDTEGWELTPDNPCYWHKNFVNINGRAHFYKNSSWHPIVPGVIIQGHSLINTLPYEIDKLLALSLHPGLTPHPRSTAAAIAEIIAAAKAEYSIDLGNPFHMSTLLSSLQKEKNVSLSSRILSWSNTIKCEQGLKKTCPTTINWARTIIRVTGCPGLLGSKHQPGDEPVRPDNPTVNPVDLATWTNPRTEPFEPLPPTANAHTLKFCFARDEI
ncbi:hypothetical protein OUZ56_012461 [Daphnia magna]|uniref:Uncharacterized protein n=1 Tax=Daphnia magna TaxID=35525 RepID=A0ABQ9Z368_9CRUS|nr:hypothetical protein OUZ56_012461 [Daphnia magna]